MDKSTIFGLLGIACSIAGAIVGGLGNNAKIEEAVDKKLNEKQEKQEIQEEEV